MTPMNSRKKFLRKIVIAGLVVAILSAVYVHFGILPGNARLYAIKQIDSLSGKKVQFDKALYFPFHGFIFYNVRVREQNGTPLFSAARYGIDVKIIPFLREKKIVVASIYLDSPVVDLVLEPRQKKAPPKEIKTELSGQITVPTTGDARKIRLQDLSEGPDYFLPENVSIEQIQISNGTLTLRKSEDSPLLETLREINVRMAFHQPPLLYFDGSLRLGKTSYASVNLTGTWDLKTADYHFNLDTQWGKIPQWLKEYQRGHFLALEDGRVQLITELKSVGEEKVLFHARADASQAKVTMRSASYLGSMAINAKGLFNFDTKHVERYAGSIRLEDVTILNLSPKIIRLDHVGGNILFRPDLLTIESLEGKYKELPFEGKGTIRSFKDLILDGEIRTRANPDQILALIPQEQKKFLAGLDIQGKCQTLTTLHGSLKNIPALSTEHALSLRQASVLGPAGKFSLTNLSCDLISGSQGLKISSASFDYEKQSYRASITIPKDPAIAGDMTLRSDHLSLKSRYRLKDGAVAIENASAQLPGIHANFKGWLYFLNQPTLDITGKARLEVAVMAAKISWLKGVVGTLDSSFAFRGAWNQVARSQISFNAQSPAIDLPQKIHLENLLAEGEFKNGDLSISHLTASAYGGMFGLKGSFRLADSGTPFDTDFYLNDLNLTRLASELPLENKKLAGNLLLQASLRGTLKNQTSYTGSGSISIKNGYLWETAQFKAMGTLPLVRVEGLDLVTFRSMGAAFQIRDKKINTQDLALESETVHLGLRGSVSFNQELDFLMNIEYTSAVFLGAEDAGGLVPMVVNQAAGLISEYRVSGTLKKPQYDKVSAVAPDKIGKKIGGLLGALTSN